MLKRTLITLSATLLCMFAFSTNASAQGFDIRAALGADLMMLHSSENDDFELAENGMTAKLTFGYSFGFFGVYLEQNLGGFFARELNNEKGDKRAIQGDGGAFFGGTYLVGRGIYPVLKNIQLDLGFGIGVVYSSGDDYKPGTSPFDVTLNSDYYTAPVIFNEKLEPSAAFAMKFTFSFAYFITDMIGIGAYLDYNLAIKTLDMELGLGIKKEAKLLYHDVDPGIQLVIKI